MQPHRLEPLESRAMLSGDTGAATDNGMFSFRSGPDDAIYETDRAGGQAVRAAERRTPRQSKLKRAAKTTIVVLPASPDAHVNKVRPNQAAAKASSKSVVARSESSVAHTKPQTARPRQPVVRSNPAS